MRVRSAVLSSLFVLLGAGRSGAVDAQAVSSPVVRSTVPARFEAGDTLTVSFRYQVPDSVGRAQVRILLVSGDDVVGAVRRVRPSVVQGAGEGQALEVFPEALTADGIRIVLRAPGGFRQTSEIPLGVGTGAGSSDLRRPGWIDPRGPGGPGPEPPAPDEPLSPPGQVLALVVDPGVSLAALSRAPRDTLTVQEAVRFSPLALQRLTTELSRPTPARPSGLELLRRDQSEALARALRTEGAADRVERPLAPSEELRPAAPDTLGGPGPWTIEPDGSMRRTHPDGTVDVIDPQGNRMTCEPEPGSQELRCIMPLFAQIPRVIPSSELATVDVDWLESMDAWLQQLADDALTEMRTLVADDASIDAYLGLEEGQNLYQRLDQRLDFLSRLIN
ncbi:MAG: hypothetical protein P8188_07960 [Gemmatimonadota bacterium]